FTVTNTTAGSVSVTITADGVTLDDQPTITFAAGAISTTSSTVSPSPATDVTANGTDASTVTVTLVDANGNAISGVAPGEFTIDVGTNATASAVSAGGAPGTYTFTVTSTTAETITVVVTARTATLASQPTIEFVAGPVDPAQSMVTASPTEVTTGGSD
ncbi:MAG TPA: invasin domain 3-containing protein, partial [Longimicrobiales bacterium]|nr:invasin domain 3-containing protein [Longimicrobiales bacterium]